MFIEVRIISSKAFIGKRVKMSFSNDLTFQLWNGFMPRRHEIVNSIGSKMYSAEIYPSGFFKAFDPIVQFEKWAAVEVSAADRIPEDMEVLHSPEGLYAVFLFKGTTTDAAAFYNTIFSQWLPANGYVADDRPHFALMGVKYINNDPESEEEIWIPVKTIS